MYPLEANALSLGAAATADGTTTITVDVSMKESSSISAWCAIATANAGNYLKIQRRTSSGASWEDVVGAVSTPTTNGHVAAVSIARFIGTDARIAVVRGATTVLGEIFVMTGGPQRLVPATHGATIKHTAVNLTTVA